MFSWIRAGCEAISLALKHVHAIFDAQLCFLFDFNCPPTIKEYRMPGAIYVEHYSSGELIYQTLRPLDDPSSDTSTTSFPFTSPSLSPSPLEPRPALQGTDRFLPVTTVLEAFPDSSNFPEPTSSARKTEFASILSITLLFLMILALLTSICCYSRRRTAVAPEPAGEVEAQQQGLESFPLPPPSLNIIPITVNILEQGPTSLRGVLAKSCVLENCSKEKTELRKELRLAREQKEKLNRESLEKKESLGSALKAAKDRNVTLDLEVKKAQAETTHSENLRRLAQTPRVVGPRSERTMQLLNKVKHLEASLETLHKGKDSLQRDHDAELASHQSSRKAFRVSTKILEERLDKASQTLQDETAAHADKRMKLKDLTKTVVDMRHRLIESKDAHAELFKKHTKVKLQADWDAEKKLRELQKVHEKCPANRRAMQELYDLKITHSTCPKKPAVDSLGKDFTITRLRSQIADLRSRFELVVRPARIEAEPVSVSQNDADTHQQNEPAPIGQNEPEPQQETGLVVVDKGKQSDVAEPVRETDLTADEIDTIFESETERARKASLREAEQERVQEPVTIIESETERARKASLREAELQRVQEPDINSSDPAKPAIAPVVSPSPPAPQTVAQQPRPEGWTNGMTRYVENLLPHRTRDADDEELDQLDVEDLRRGVVRRYTQLAGRDDEVESFVAVLAERRMRPRRVRSPSPAEEGPQASVISSAESAALDHDMLRDEDVEMADVGTEASQLSALSKPPQPPSSQLPQGDNGPPDQMDSTDLGGTFSDFDEEDQKMEETPDQDTAESTDQQMDIEASSSGAVPHQTASHTDFELPPTGAFDEHFQPSQSGPHNQVPPPQNELQDDNLGFDDGMMSEFEAQWEMMFGIEDANNMQQPSNASASGEQPAESGTGYGPEPSDRPQYVVPQAEPRYVRDLPSIEEEAPPLFAANMPAEILARAETTGAQWQPRPYIPQPPPRDDSPDSIAPQAEPRYVRALPSTEEEAPPLFAAHMPEEISARAESTAQAINNPILARLDSMEKVGEDLRSPEVSDQLRKRPVNKRKEAARAAVQATADSIHVPALPASVDHRQPGSGLVVDPRVLEHATYTGDQLSGPSSSALPPNTGIEADSTSFTESSVSDADDVEDEMAAHEPFDMVRAQQLARELAQNRGTIIEGHVSEWPTPIPVRGGYQPRSLSLQESNLSPAATATANTSSPVPSQSSPLYQPKSQPARSGPPNPAPSQSSPLYQPTPHSARSGPSIPAQSQSSPLYQPTPHFIQPGRPNHASSSHSSLYQPTPHLVQPGASNPIPQFPLPALSTLLTTQPSPLYSPTPYLPQSASQPAPNQPPTPKKEKGDLEEGEIKEDEKPYPDFPEAGFSGDDGF